MVIPSMAALFPFININGAPPADPAPAVANKVVPSAVEPVPQVNGGEFHAPFKVTLDGITKFPATK